MGVVPPGCGVVEWGCADEAEKPLGTDASAQGLHLNGVYVSNEPDQGIVTYEGNNLVVGVGEVSNSRLSSDPSGRGSGADPL